jgi:hypothetical protein
MSYRFRLTFHHSAYGFFQIDEEFATFTLGDGTELTLTARNGDTLSKASQFYIDVGSFPDEKTARACGERLRLRLRVLNSLLGLGFTVPLKDTVRNNVPDEQKANLTQAVDCVILDKVEGISVFPDDGKHVEICMSIQARVRPSDPAYLFNALSEIWPLEMTLTVRTATALEILSRATAETSPRSRFLLIYLAAEQVVDKGRRSSAAIILIGELLEIVRRRSGEDKDIASLEGSLSKMCDQSFKSALMRIAEVNPSVKINGMPLKALFSKSAELRDKLAHTENVPKKLNIDLLSNNLRHFVMNMIWTENKIPDLTVQGSSSTFSIPEGGATIRIL